MTAESKPLGNGEVAGRAVILAKSTAKDTRVTTARGQDGWTIKATTL